MNKSHYTIFFELKEIKLITLLSLYAILIFNIALPANAESLVKKDLSGFKYIQFGMTEEELENRGIWCVVEICHPTEKAPPLTILGQNTIEEDAYETSIFLTSGSPKIVYEIAAYIDIESSKVTSTLSQSLGSPDRWGERDVWFFKNGAALAVYNPKLSSNTVYRTRIFYQSPDYAIRLYERHPFKLRVNLNSSDY